MADSPKATIRYVLARETCEMELIDGEPIGLVLAVMRGIRELNAKGGSVMWVDFATNGTVRRRYVDGRARATRPRKSLTTDD